MWSVNLNALTASFKQWLRLLSFLTMAIGGLALSGWLFHIPWLTGTGGSAPTTVPNTAVCFIIAGLALRALQSEHRFFACTAGGIIAMTGLLTLIEYLGGFDFGIDRLLIQAPPEPAQTEFPGRMARATAVNFLLAGIISLILLRKRLQCTYGLYAAQILAALVLLSGLFSLIGHLYDAQALRTFAPYQSMSLYTTLGFLVLASGLLLAYP